MSTPDARHVLYCFYLKTSRSDAFLKDLCSNNTKVSVLDFTALRALYRGQATDPKQRKSEQTNRLRHLGARVNYTCVPTIPFPHFRPVALLLSVVWAALYSAFWGLSLIGSKINRVVFYNGHPLFTPILFVAALTRKKIVTDLGDVLYLVDNSNKLTFFLEMAFLIRSSEIICVSQLFKNHLKKLLKASSPQISVLSAAVPESLIRSFSGTLNARRRRQLRDSLHINDSEKLLVYAGSLWKKKIPNVGIRDLQGVELLCEAFEKANEQGTPTTLLMLGFSKQASELDKFRKGKWRERLIEWGSYKAGSEKHLEALGGADYLCLPSFPCETYALYDRFKTIEYMAAGKRIIAADTDINRTILKEMGRYYDDGDSSSMGQLIADLPLNENLIFDQNLNENALQNYNWDRRISEKAIDKVIWGDA